MAENELPLPNIDMPVDVITVTHRFPSLIVSGYNQINMDPLDVEKTGRTPIENFHYTVILFSLKYAGATYQRTMSVIFHDMLHNCLEDYVDDILVKPKEVYHHVDDLSTFYTRCKKYNLRMNHLKCLWCVSWKIFGVHCPLERNRP